MPEVWSWLWAQGWAAQGICLWLEEPVGREVEALEFVIVLLRVEVEVGFEILVQELVKELIHPTQTRQSMA